MHSQLFKMICRMGIFVICAQTIIHFRPDRSYEKYLKLLVSIMILIQIFLPVGEFFLGDYHSNIMEQVDRFQKELEESTREAQFFSFDSLQYAEQMTLEEVRREAEKQNREQAEGQSGEQTEEQGGEQTEEQSGERAEEQNREPVKIEQINIGMDGGRTD